MAVERISRVLVVLLRYSFDAGRNETASTITSVSLRLTNQLSVATTKAEYPEKLRDDCIVEAICELRFDTSELAEVVVGRLTDAAP